MIVGPKYLYLNIHICLNGDSLVTKTITITKSAYEALLREKREHESFSNLALRLTSKHGTLKECLGLWKLSRKERKIFKEIKKSLTRPPTPQELELQKFSKQLEPYLKRFYTGTIGELSKPHYQYNARL